MNHITCKCGGEITEENISYYNGTNEEGEEYGVVHYYCPNCTADIETSQWGHWENAQDAFEYLQEYILKQS